MTVPEYTKAVAEALETRDLKPWEYHDLLLNVRTVQRRGKVDGFDLLLLDWAGHPWSGPVQKPKPKPVKAKQQSLF